MGFDIVSHKKGKQTVIIEIKESLHKALFKDPTTLSEMQCIIKLSDYYKTDVWLAQGEICQLIKELSYIRTLLSTQQAAELQVVIDWLSDPTIERVHIAGD